MTHKLKIKTISKKNLINLNRFKNPSTFPKKLNSKIFILLFLFHYFILLIKHIYIYIIKMAPKAEKKPASKAPAEKPALKTASTDGAKKRTKARKETYSSYIYKVLKQTHPDTGISQKLCLL